MRRHFVILHAHIHMYVYVCLTYTYTCMYASLPMYITGLQCLQPRYLDIINSLPESVENTVNKLEGVFTNDCIIAILSAPSPVDANKMILDYLVKDVSSSEDLLGLCDQLEKITESSNLLSIVAEMRAGLLCAYTIV